MNLYPGDAIEVGVTRAPTPAAPPPAVVAPLAAGAVVAPLIGEGAVGALGHCAPITSVVLNPDGFADLETVRAMVAHWTRDQLYRLGNVLTATADQRIPGQLVDVMRALYHEQPGTVQSPIVRVEFVTNANYDDGVYWDEDTVCHHRADGTVTEAWESPSCAETPEAAEEALWDGFVELLADYSRTAHPQHGDHLIVDLVTGEFDHSGKWSLV
ncbi:hypothetical protein ACLQ2N_32895 [Streptomyces sp. DT224]|uniref:hypothetical protein n=1 Tax=Streptomyces sp. DT224 TaxID=3393426 RepID=UPI003CF4DAA0